MGFCTKCGKPLQDGEICSCQQAVPQPQMSVPQPQMTAPQPQMSAPQPQMTVPQPQMSAPQPQMSAPRPAGPNIGTELTALIKGLITSPVEAISAYTSKANIALVAIIIGAHALTAMFVRLFRMLIANAKAEAAVKKSADSIWEYMSDYYQVKAKVYETGEIFANMFKEILVVIAMAAVIALVIWLLTKALDKAANATYVQALSVYSVASVITIPALVLSWVIGLTGVGFLNEISTCVSVFANVMGYAFIFIGIRSLCRQEKNIPLIMAVSFVCANFVNWIIGLMF